MTLEGDDDVGKFVVDPSALFVPASEPSDDQSDLFPIIGNDPALSRTDDLQFPLAERAYAVLHAPNKKDQVHYSIPVQSLIQ